MLKLLLGALSIVFLLISLNASIPVAEAQPLTIFIKPDGSIDPYSEALRQEGNTYVLTASMNCSINVQKNNIVLEGANHTIQGPGSSQNFVAITLMASNVTVKSFRISGWRAGVYGAFNNNTITGNEFTDNYQAIAIYANNYIVSENEISVSTSVGILIDSGALQKQGDNNVISRNQIANNNWAIDILNSNGTTIKENNVTGNAVILTLGSLRGNISLVGFHMVYLNNFIDNNRTLHIPFGGPTVAGFVPVSPAGYWDNGIVGNYWSDYSQKYPNATEIGNSGIANTPYLIQHSTSWSRTYANGTYLEGIAVFGIAADNHPIIAPYKGSDAILADASPNKSTLLTPTPVSSPTYFPNRSPLPTQTTAPSESPSLQYSPTLSPSPSIPEFSTWTVAVAEIVAFLSVAFIISLAEKYRRSNRKKPF